MITIKNRLIRFIPVLMILLMSILSPVIVSAASSGLTWECGTNDPATNTYTAGNCTFADMVAATKHVLNWAVGFALFFSVIVIAYAGFLFMQSGGSSSKRDQAKGMLTKVAIGIAWVIAAWLVVNLVTTVLMGRPLDTIFSQ